MKLHLFVLTFLLGSSALAGEIVCTPLDDAAPKAQVLVESEISKGFIQVRLWTPVELYSRPSPAGQWGNSGILFAPFPARSFDESYGVYISEIDVRAQTMKVEVTHQANGKANLIQTLVCGEKK